MNEMKETQTATEGKTVLGPATAICGSAKNIPLYMHADFVYMPNNHTLTQTHTYTQILYIYKYPVVAQVAGLQD